MQCAGLPYSMAPFHHFMFLALHAWQYTCTTLPNSRASWAAFCSLHPLWWKKTTFSPSGHFQSCSRNAIMENWLLLATMPSSETQTIFRWITGRCKNSYKSPFGSHFWPWQCIQKILLACRFAYHYHWASQLISVCSSKGRGFTKQRFPQDQMDSSGKALLAAPPTNS